MVHKLVATAFIKNLKNYSCINHIDEDKTNNNVDNLEWCTYSYNINYGNRNQIVSKKLKNKKLTLEHRKKLSEAAKKKTLIRDKTGKIIKVIKNKGE